MEKKTFTQLIKLADHYKAIGCTDHYLLDADDDLPWAHVNEVEPGSYYRMGVPVGLRITAAYRGMTFTWCPDLEGRDANGTGVTAFCRNRVRDVFDRLPSHAQPLMAAVLENEVLPKIEERAEELRRAYLKHQTSADLVRGVVAGAKQACA